MHALNRSTDPRSLFPARYRDSPFLDLCGRAFGTLDQLMPEVDLPRVPSPRGLHQSQDDLLKRYGQLPVTGAADPLQLVEEMTGDFLAGAVNWRCPELQYNLGAAVNVVAAAMYAVSLDVNVYLINDGLAGNAVAAEAAVSSILADLTGIDPQRAYGLFTFGGTGTMAYGIKSGLRKAFPDSARTGVPSSARVVITEDAHFSHATAADWLGLGTEQLVVLPAGEDRRTDMDQVEALLRAELDAGHQIATIIVNGGTTYDHAIDDIAAMAGLRDRLVAEYGLPYRPHLHVDSVVGWAWLMLTDEALGEPEPDSATVAALREQRRRIHGLRFADSWGVDFHKGVGVCPIDCSFVQFNDRIDCAVLRKGGPSGAELHQLAQDFSAVSPVDYTLETSRAGGKAIAALASLHSLGHQGYGTILTRLIDAAFLFRAAVDRQDGMTVLNPHALGYQTMVRLHRPDRAAADWRHEILDPSAEMADAVRDGNSYLRAFFEWDQKTRMDRNAGGVVYSFSSRYVTTASGVPISGLKFYPTSPLIGREHMEAAVALLAERKAVFDRAVWRG
ncbi:pyridoxal-dependent decarboxylase [Kitasatospora cystarginea]|uniref:Pyridoxal-dependent decarboxylase n=1 Tax=Kitasatospora cystarginea TaxID=58350 RepID=A0ABN3EN36_9ACTN